MPLRSEMPAATRDETLKNPQQLAVGSTSFPFSRGRASTDIDTAPVATNASHGTSSASTAQAGVASMKSLFTLHKEAFEITTPPEHVAQQTYHFKRSNRKSVMRRLGLYHIEPDRKRPGSSETVDPYSKNNTLVSTVIYMAVMIGFGTFQLSQAVAKCGIVPGFIAIIGLSYSHYFIGCRIVEMPKLIKRNLETYSDMAGACFNEIARWIVGIMFIMSLMGACTSYLHYELNIWGRFLHQDEDYFLNNWEDEQERVLIAKRLLAKNFYIFLPIVVFYYFNQYSRATVKHRYWFARCCLISILLAAVMELLASIFYRVRVESDSHRTHWASSHDFWEGMSEMIYAFSGVSILPYVVASMAHPEEARDICAFCSSFLCVFYLVMGVVCYWGWGDQVKQTTTVLSEIYKTGWCMFAHTMSVLCLVRTLCTYILFFMPLVIEFEQLFVFFFDEAPPTLLGLPWAIRQSHSRKQFSRFMLLIFTVAPLFFPKAQQNIYLRVISIYPLLLTNFVFPPLFSLGSMLIHIRKARASFVSAASVLDDVRPTGTESTTFALDESCEDYIGGSLRCHIAATAFMTLVLTLFTCTVIMCSPLTHAVTPTANEKNESETCATRT